MANYPDYDLNTPFTPINANILDSWDKMSGEDQTNYLYDMWKNKAVQNTYEPGSIFKIITASIGLEEGIVEADTPNTFYCAGNEVVDNIKFIDKYGYFKVYRKEFEKNGFMSSF